MELVEPPHEAVPALVDLSRSLPCSSRALGEHLSQQPSLAFRIDYSQVCGRDDGRRDVGKPDC